MNEHIIPQKRVLYSILVANELGNDLTYVLKFSDPDGVRTGKSGYSFGVSQFDTKNNRLALDCLEECEFTTSEINSIVTQSCNEVELQRLENKLADHSDVVEKYDNMHMEQAIKYCQDLLNLSKISVMSDEAFYHIVDYHNQFHFSKNGKLHRYLESMVTPITSTMILNFKLTWIAWGRKRPDDVYRRFKNISKIMEQENKSK